MSCLSIFAASDYVCKNQAFGQFLSSFCVLHLPFKRKFQVDCLFHLEDTATFVGVVPGHKIAGTATFVGVGLYVMFPHTLSGIRNCKILDFCLLTIAYGQFSTLSTYQYSLYLSITVESPVENCGTSGSTLHVRILLHTCPQLFLRITVRNDRHGCC